MGHYATDLLIWLVREHRQLTVEEAHFQLSLRSAQSVAIHDREALLPGYWADVVVYDLDELYFDMSRYETVHDMPNGGWRRSGRACGYRHVLVNGEGPNACTFDRHVEDASFPPGDVPRLVAQQLDVVRRQPRIDVVGTDTGGRGRQDRFFPSAPPGPSADVDHDASFGWVRTGRRVEAVDHHDDAGSVVGDVHVARRSELEGDAEVRGRVALSRRQLAAGESDICRLLGDVVLDVRLGVGDGWDGRARWLVNDRVVAVADSAASRSVEHGAALAARLARLPFGHGSQRAGGGV